MSWRELFAFRLALALGKKNPYRLMRQMSEPLFRRWMDYCAEEPFGQMVQWRMLARIGAAAAQSQEISAEDFMPPTREDEDES